MVTGGAGRVGPVLLHPLPQGSGQRGGRGILQFRDVRRGWRGRSGEQVLQDPLSPLHRTRPRRVAGDRQDARLPEQAPPPFGVDRDADQGVARHARNAVVLRQPLVDEGVVRIEELEQAAVLPHDRPEELLGLPAHRSSQVVVEPGESASIGRGLLEPAQLKPLAGEVFDKCPRLVVLEHADGLRHDLRIGRQFAPGRGTKEPVVGHAAPEEGGESRGHLKVVERADLPSRRLLLNAKQERGRHQDRRDRGLHRPLDRLPVLAGRLIDPRERLDLGIGCPAAEGPRGQRSEDLLRLIILFCERALGIDRLPEESHVSLGEWIGHHADRPHDEDAIDGKIAILLLLRAGIGAGEVVEKADVDAMRAGRGVQPNLEVAELGLAVADVELLLDRLVEGDGHLRRFRTGENACGTHPQDVAAGGWKLHVVPEVPV